MPTNAATMMEPSSISDAVTTTYPTTSTQTRTVEGDGASHLTAMSTMRLVCRNHWRRIAEVMASTTVSA